MTINIIYVYQLYLYETHYSISIPVSGPVRDLQTNSPHNSTLVISWRPPTTPNGNIISYTVRIENLRDGTKLMDHSLAMTSLTENRLGTINNPYCHHTVVCMSSLHCYNVVSTK